MKLKEAQTKLEELKGVTEPSEEQKAELASLETFVQEETKQVSRLTELKGKDENLLTSEEVDELLNLSEKFKGDDIGKEPPASPRKYAGIYETPEELLKGINSSETERKRIEEEMVSDPALAKAVEDIYKDSQRVVTKLVDVKKKAEKPAGKKPLEERLFLEMTKEEYDAWEKLDKLSAQSWLNKAQTLHVAQAKSGKKVFEKHPEFYAMNNGVIPPSEDFKKFREIEDAHPDWLRDPNGPELILAELEKPSGKPAVKAPAKEPAKPDLGNASGKAKGASPAKGKRLSPEEFEALSSDEQRAYMEGSVKT